MSSQTLVDVELPQRLGWLIRLRWFAAAGVALLAVLGRVALGLDLPAWELSLLAVTIAMYNLVFALLSRRWLPAVNGQVEGELPIPDHASTAPARWLVALQIAADLFALALLLHFTGGAENPFAAYFVFHSIIASIFLSPRTAYALAGLAVTLFAGLAAGEATGVLRHVDLFSAAPVPLYRFPAFLVETTGAMATTLLASVYITSSIRARLRLREEQLAAAYHRAAAAEQAKSVYLRQVSHHLKTPIAAVESLLQVALQGMAGEVAPGVQDLLQRAERRTGQAVSIVNDLLTLARAREAGTKAPPQHFPLAAAMEKILAAFRPVAEHRGLVLQAPLPPSSLCLVADREGVEQVLENLVDNALKYTPAPGTVTVSVEEQGDQLVLTVSDTGIGIPPEEQGRIFDEFYRAHNARELPERGTGLGLAIVLAVVQAHEGSIALQSKEGQGSTFVVRLPSAVHEIHQNLE